MTEHTSLKLKALKAKLHAQVKDKIGADDYFDQIIAYQHIMNDHLNLSIELAELVEVALASPTAHLPLD